MWTAFKVQGRWKCIRASVLTAQGAYIPQQNARGPLDLVEDNTRKMKEVDAADVKLASLYKMMEMSDVGMCPLLENLYEFWLHGLSHMYPQTQVNA
jgi:hypothetical protein